MAFGEDLPPKREWFAGPTYRLQKALGEPAVKDMVGYDYDQEVMKTRPRVDTLQFRLLRREVESSIYDGVVVQGYDVLPDDTSGGEPAEYTPPRDKGPENYALPLPTAESGLRDQAY